MCENILKQLSVDKVHRIDVDFKINKKYIFFLKIINNSSVTSIK